MDLCPANQYQGEHRYAARGVRHRLISMSEDPCGKVSFQLMFACPVLMYDARWCELLQDQSVFFWHCILPDSHGVTCSAMTGMLMALGSRLQRLTMHVRKGDRDHNTMSGLVPTILMHCPLLTHLALENIGPSTLAEVGLHDSCHVLTVGHAHQHTTT